VVELQFAENCIANYAHFGYVVSLVALCWPWYGAVR
jgi:hypothetical protein